MAMSLMQFHLHNFFHTLINSNFNFPMYTKLCRIAEAMAYSQPIEEEEHVAECINKINKINNSTHPELDINLSIVEAVIIKNNQYGLDKTIDINNRSIKLSMLYLYVDEAVKQLTKIVMDIARKYSLEIPIQSGTSSSKVW